MCKCSWGRNATDKDGSCKEQRAWLINAPVNALPLGGDMGFEKIKRKSGRITDTARANSGPNVRPMAFHRLPGGMGLPSWWYGTAVRTRVRSGSVNNN